MENGQRLDDSTERCQALVTMLYKASLSLRNVGLHFQFSQECDKVMIMGPICSYDLVHSHRHSLESPRQAPMIAQLSGAVSLH